MKIEDFISNLKEKVEALQVTEFKSESVEIKVVNDNLKKSVFSDKNSYEVKAKINGKYVKINTEQLTPNLYEILKQQSEIIESDYKDNYIENEKKLEFRNNNTNTINIAEKIKTMIGLNQLRKTHDSISSITSEYEWNCSEKRIVNTNGVDLLSAKENCAFYVSVVAKNEKDTVTFNDIVYTTSDDDINMNQTCQNVIENAEKFLIKERIKTGVYNVVFSSRFMSNLLKSIMEILSQENVRKKLSYLEGKEQKEIANKIVSIVEDPRNEKFPGYAYFDDEGTETYKKLIIKDGVLQTFLYNNQEAEIKKIKSTGNGYGKISARNLYLIPRDKTEEELIKKLNNGLYITNYMSSGGVFLNAIDGKISAPIFGFIVKEGKITNAFETCILSTNIIDLLRNIKEIGNNLEFKTEISGSPSVLAEKMSIASN